jgi:hypothetical protein
VYWLEDSGIGQKIGFTGPSPAFYAMTSMIEIKETEKEASSRWVWPYIALIKGYRCLDCCTLIEFEERMTYFATKFCESCKPLHLRTRLYISQN